MVRTSFNHRLGSSRRVKKRATPDRISDLPDSIIGIILSLLSTKDAFATSILSKRWKNLWTTTTNLDFRYAGCVVAFIRFVNYVMILHNPGLLNRFSLTWQRNCIPFYVSTWINGALNRDVRELAVNIGCFFILPTHVKMCLFNSEVLRSLDLDYSFCVTNLITISLPRLEMLRLVSVYFQSDKAFRKLLDGCPVLLSLSIEMDVGKMIQHNYINIVDGLAFNVDDGSSFKCVISSASLKHLHMCVYCKYLRRPAPQALCCVFLNAPSLEYVNLENMIHSISIQQGSLASLDEANISVCGRDSEEPNYCNSFVDAVSAFGCAKTLSLNDSFIRAISRATKTMTVRFNRLTRLEVSIDLNHWSSLEDFIKQSDNLEVLIIKKKQGYNGDIIDLDNSNWTNPGMIPGCLLNSLRIVSVCAYDGDADELAMVEYIISNGSVLKLMQICFVESINDDWERKCKLIQQICKVTRKSSVCTIKFPEYGSEIDAL